MKAVLALVAPAVLFAGPALAGDDILQGSLAVATKRAMDVAPWVDVTVHSVSVDDSITWVAQTTGRQLYSCAARPTADAILSRDQVACVRVALNPAQRGVMAARYDRTLRANYANIPFPGQAITTAMDESGLSVAP